MNIERSVKIYDKNRKLLANGTLLSLSGSMIKVKGHDLPLIKINTEVYIEVFHAVSGISPYICKISIASENQLNAIIINSEPITERRNSLKVQTDLSFYIEELIRNDEDITKEVPNMKINILNLSIGGMLISSNYDLKVNDTIEFNFQYLENQIIGIKAKVIRIDKVYDKITRKLTALNYGCKFDKLPSYDEAVVTKYLFDRQIQLYKNR